MMTDRIRQAKAAAMLHRAARSPEARAAVETVIRELGLSMFVDYRHGIACVSSVPENFMRTFAGGVRRPKLTLVADRELD